MERDNVFRLMSRYDFQAPIGVNVIFEESDEEMLDTIIEEEEEDIDSEYDEKEDDITIIDEVITESINNETNSTNITVSTEAQFRNDILVENQAPECLNEVCPTTKAKPSYRSDDEKIKDQNSSTTNNNSQILIDKTNHKNQTEEIPSQEIYNNEELTTYIKDLLNGLSRHLLLITEDYYDYYNRNSVPMSPILSAQLNKRKEMFFEFCYNTVVMLILPQENNETLINKFLEHTVEEANKAFTWKCGRHHIEPFFYEMIDWSRRRKERNKSAELPKTNNTNTTNDAVIVLRNENKLLKNRLSKPLEPFNISRTNDALVGVQKSQEINVSNIENAKCAVSQPSEQNVRNDTKQSLRKVRRKTQTCNNKPILPQIHSQNDTIQGEQAMQARLRMPEAATESMVNSQLGVIHRQENIEQITPIVTSVTSLNPTSTPMVGRCCICGKTTRLRCSKCKNFSYCGNACKALDPRNDRNTCGKTG